MASNTYQDEADLITVPAPANVTSDFGVLVGELFGIAVHDALLGEDVTIATEGAFWVEKVSAQAWSVGAAVYWDNTAKLFTTVATSNKKVGVAIVAANNPSTRGVVRLGISTI